MLLYNSHVLESWSVVSVLDVIFAGQDCSNRNEKNERNLHLDAEDDVCARIDEWWWSDDERWNDRIFYSPALDTLSGSACSLMYEGLALYSLNNEQAHVHTTCETTLSVTKYRSLYVHAIEVMKSTCCVENADKIIFIYSISVQLRFFSRGILFQRYSMRNRVQCWFKQ